MIDNIGIYGLAFMIATVKFLFAASIVSASSLSPFQIAIATGLGALCSFNVFYWSSNYFMNKAKNKKAKNRSREAIKKKTAFTKVNKYIVKAKMSKSGFWLICLFAPLLLSIPLGTFIVAKFYRHHKLTYPLVMISLSLYAFILAYFNNALFSLFK